MVYRLFYLEKDTQSVQAHKALRYNRGKIWLLPDKESSSLSVDHFNIFLWTNCCCSLPYRQDLWHAKISGRCRKEHRTTNSK